ncbi:TonB-dependent receptor plug domain-containing protein [Flavobacterium foetidum]|uniref:TonB-dependent receptor plug domain-containing protein n=1 Tax=Flavobacterium foetidum TaxID=2026681 RepID=UPI001074F6C4|nr:TonB-dependent receptor [Flavobacterium foetidum]KAF2517173.1 TonB-dependent receptor [Flavobacterium foetidum]
MTKVYLAVLGLISAALNAQAQNDSIININEVIIQDNRFSTPISKKNRNIYVIDKTVIEKLPGRSIQEVLQYANGVDIRQRGPFGTQADVSIDGGSFEQTVVLLNGTKIIDPQTAHNMLNIPIPVEVIERIEIIRGPAAFIYGVNSLTGAINIITKKPTESGVLVSSYAGSNFEKDSQDTGDTFFGTGIQLGAVLSKEKHQHSIFASHDKSNGYRYNTAFENNKIFYQGNVQLNNSNEILSSFGYINNGFGANGFYAAPGDINSSEVIQTTFANLQSRHAITENWKIMPRVSYRYNYDDYRYYGIANLNAGRSQHYTNSIAAELNSTVKLSKGEIGFGAEFRNEDIHSSNIGDHDRNNVGIYAEYRTNFFERLSVNLGTYLNYNSDYKWQIYPGIDASYVITDEFKIVGNVGTSQRIPSFTDLYLRQTGNIGNPDLDSENAFQSEIGFKFNKRKLTFNANYFYRKITNYIDWTRMVTTVPWQSQNTGDLSTNGLNLRSTYRIDFAADSRLNIVLGYSYLDAEFKNSRTETYSKYLISSLKHQLTNTIDYQYKKFSVLFATRFNERVTGPSYWINDFRISQSIKKFTVFADAQNIFNTTYFEVGAVPLPSRWFSLGVKFASF